MKEKIKKFLNLINQWKVILIILLIVFGLFYWFQIRPSIIYSDCNRIAADKAEKLLKTKSEMEGGYKYKEAAEKELFLKDDYDSYYEKCLREKGLFR